MTEAGSSSGAGWMRGCWPRAGAWIRRRIPDRVGRSADRLRGVCGAAFTRLSDLWTGDRMLSAKLALEGARTDLGAVNERLSMALRAGRAGLFDWNMNHRGTGRDPGSPQFELLFVPRDSLQGAPQEPWSGRIVAEDMEKLRAVRRRCAEETPEDLDVDFRIAGADGKLRWLACQGRVSYDDAGAPLRMSGVAIDITARKRADAALAELNQELERRVEERTAELERLNAEKEALAYSVSHDLRKPLRAIHGFTRILLDSYADRFDEEALRRLRIIRTTTEFMGKLIDDLLSLSCLSRRTLHVDPVDIGALALSVFDDLDIRDPRRDVSLMIAEPPQAHCDRELTRIALEQLLENAVRFTVGRERAEIEVGGAVKGSEHVYWVKDNGIGFDMSKVEKLFHPFRRMHAADGFEGTGIGLAVVKRAIELQGGRVWAEGKPDEGATFYFAFPSG